MNILHTLSLALYDGRLTGPKLEASPKVHFRLISMVTKDDVFMVAGCNSSKSLRVLLWVIKYE